MHFLIYYDNVLVKKLFVEYRRKLRKAPVN